MDIQSILVDSGLFQGVDEETMQYLVDNCIVDVFEDGEVIFKEGETDPIGVFVIGGGGVIITTALAEEDKKRLNKEQDFFLTSLSSGDTFGEMSIIDRGPRSATARAAGLTSVCFIPETLFQQLVERDPRAAYLITRNIAIIVTRRLREANYAFKHEALLG